MLNPNKDKRIIEEEEEELDISLKMDILSAIKSLKETISEPAKKPDATPVSFLSGSATSMSLDKDLWELMDQGIIDTPTKENEIAEMKKKESNLIVHEAQKLPKEYTPDQLFKEAVRDLSSILDSINDL